MTADKERIKQLEASLKRMVFVFDDLMLRGCRDRSWDDWQNGNGRDLSKEINGAINTAKRVLKGTISNNETTDKQGNAGT